MKAKIIENKPVANQKLSKTHLLKEYAGEVLFFFFSKYTTLASRTRFYPSHSELLYRYTVQDHAPEYRNALPLIFEFQHPHRTIYQVMCSFVYTTRLASRTRFYPSHSELLYRYTVQDHAPEYRNVPRTLVQIVLSRMPWRRR